MHLPLLAFLLLEVAPNVWSFLTTVASVGGAAFAAWMAYRASRDTKAQNPQLDRIHTLVNGNLDIERRRTAAYRAALEAAGVKVPEVN